ncbi:MAG TPA: SigE family RNA polymerase sigma factor [Streptosporangiaceae bacterium]|nr:SigE family RNA polymerase sigma factor [Streptosporangiaceae bacterium]
MAARQDKVTETLVAATALGPVTADPRHDGSASNGNQDAASNGSQAGDRSQLGHAVDADAVITEIYGAHYRSLVRLATLLVHDIATAEEVVQDSFVALHAGMHRLRDSEKTLSYLRAAVVNRARSVLRHRVVVDRNAPKPPPDMPSAEHGALALIERSSVIAALRSLPERQREVVVLRFYGDLSEAQIAGAMGITRGAVKSHTSRAMAAMRTVLEREA